MAFPDVISYNIDMTDVALRYDRINGVLDIDVVNGCALLISVGTSEDQRATLCAYTIKGTIPGMLDEGVDWSGLYQKTQDMTAVDNTVRQDIEKYAGSYTPIYATDGGQMAVGVTRTDV